MAKRNLNNAEYPLSYALGDVHSQTRNKKAQVFENTQPKTTSECQRRRLAKSKTDLIYEKLQELDENAEVLDIVLPFRALGRNSSLTDVHDLFDISDPPSPPLTHKEVKSLKLNEDTALIMSGQIRQMKSKLQKMMQKSHKQKLFHDIDFIVGNIGAVVKNNEDSA